MGSWEEIEKQAIEDLCYKQGRLHCSNVKKVMDFFKERTVPKNGSDFEFLKEKSERPVGSVLCYNCGEVVKMIVVEEICPKCNC